jgi:hypothetical protein
MGAMITLRAEKISGQKVSLVLPSPAISKKPVRTRDMERMQIT